MYKRNFGESHLISHFHFKRNINGVLLQIICFSKQIIQNLFSIMTKQIIILNYLKYICNWTLEH